GRRFRHSGAVTGRLAPTGTTHPTESHTRAVQDNYDPRSGLRSGSLFVRRQSVGTRPAIERVFPVTHALYHGLTFGRPLGAESRSPRSASPAKTLKGSRAEARPSR